MFAERQEREGGRAIFVKGAKLFLRLLPPLPSGKGDSQVSPEIRRWDGLFDSSELQGQMSSLGLQQKYVAFLCFDSVLPDLILPLPLPFLAKKVKDFKLAGSSVIYF